MIEQLYEWLRRHCAKPLFLETHFFEQWRLEHMRETVLPIG